MENKLLQNEYSVIDFSSQAPPKTKLCPFCAETIQAKAIKCRFCGEFLNSERLKAVQGKDESDLEDDSEQQMDDTILFAGRPSLWGMCSAVIKGTIFFALAVFLYRYSAEELPFLQANDPETATVFEETITELPITEEPTANTQNGFSWLTLTEERKVMIGRYREMFAIGLMIMVGLILLLKMISLKCMYYEVSDSRIEFSRGIFDRRVDNLDMFRVVDIKLRRSLPDCIFGIGTVTLITTDKSDPDFIFRKIRGCRNLYDAIKRASLDADRKAGVVHLE